MKKFLSTNNTIIDTDNKTNETLDNEQNIDLDSGY